MSKEKEKNKSNKKSNSNTSKKVDNKKKVEVKNKEVKKDSTKKDVTNLKETKAKKERIIEEDFDYNEDLEEELEEYDEDFEEVEEFEEEEEIIEKSKKDSKSKKEKIVDVKVEEKETIKIRQVPDKKKIEKIEKIAKEKKKKSNSDSKFQAFMTSFDKHHVAIYSFIGGVLLTSLVAFIIWPERIATLKNGEQSVVKVAKKNYTADDLYSDMKDYYSVSLLLDDIDNDLLTKLYPETKELVKEVEANAENYYNMYKQYYNYTQEQFLEQNGFSSHEAFVNYLKLDYRRNKYLDDYLEDSLTDEEIQKYYDKNVFGDINTQHILVEVSSGDEEKSDKLDDEDAKALAEKIITKLNDGTSWEDIKKKYKDKVTFENLSYQSWDASLEDSFMNALKEMDDESYSEEPVKTSYGYHVIYRLDQKKKPSLKKSKEKIVENLISEKKEKDANLLYKSLISLRKEKNIKFNDTVMKEKYEEYCKKYK